MATRQDFQMLNDALGNLGNSFVINRQMAQQEKERQADRDLRERMLQEQMEGRKQTAQIAADARADAAAARTQPMFNWTSKGVKMQAHSLDDFGKLIQQNPADPDEDGGSTLSMSGTDANGVTVTQHMKIPKGMPKTPETQKNISEHIASFAKISGAQPKAPPGARNAFAQNMELYQRELQAVAESETPEEAQLHEQNAAMYKSWLDKQGKFAPPKPVIPTESTTETVVQKPNPAARYGDTNVPPSLSFTNTTHKVTGPTKGGAAPAAMPPASELVDVINPAGKPVKIRKAQLSDALSQGYQQP